MTPAAAFIAYVALLSLTDAEKVRLAELATAWGCALALAMRERVTEARR